MGFWDWILGRPAGPAEFREAALAAMRAKHPGATFEPSASSELEVRARWKDGADDRVALLGLGVFFERARRSDDTTDEAVGRAVRCMGDMLKGASLDAALQAAIPRYTPRPGSPQAAAAAAAPVPAARSPITREELLARVKPILCPRDRLTKVTVDGVTYDESRIDTSNLVEQRLRSRVFTKLYVLDGESSIVTIGRDQLDATGVTFAELDRAAQENLEAATGPDDVSVQEQFFTSPHNGARLPIALTLKTRDELSSSRVFSAVARGMLRRMFPGGFRLAPTNRDVLIAYWKKAEPDPRTLPEIQSEHPRPLDAGLHSPDDFLPAGAPAPPDLNVDVEAITSAPETWKHVAFYALGDLQDEPGPGTLSHVEAPGEISPPDVFRARVAPDLVRVESAEALLEDLAIIREGPFCKTDADRAAIQRVMEWIARVRPDAVGFQVEPAELAGDGTTRLRLLAKDFIRPGRE